MSSTGSAPEGADAFATRLRDAVERSGLGLEQVQRRLGRHGHDVSLATLSYWRSGRSRPSRRSTGTVAALEPVLGLTSGSLTGLLAHGGTADVAAAQPPSAGEDPLAAVDPAVLPPALADLLVHGRGRMELASDHQSVAIGADRHCTEARSRRVYRALVDGVDRVLVATSLADGTSADDVPSDVVPSASQRGTTVLERAVLAEHAVVLTALGLGRTLRRGDAVMLELELDRSPGEATETPSELLTTVPLRELVVEVRFDPATLPGRCAWYERDAEADVGGERVTGLRLDANASVLVLRHDVRAPRHGVRWTWDR